MRVTLDGQEIPSAAAPGETLGSVIDRTRAAHLDGRIIVAVCINGRTCDDACWDTELGTTLRAGDDIAFESAAPREVAADALRAVAARVADAGTRGPAIATELNAGRVADGIRDFGALIEVWQTNQHVLAQVSRLLGEDLVAAEVSGKSLEGHLDDLAGKLHMLRDALDAHDVTTLADLAHYEMPLLHMHWDKLLGALADHVEHAATAH